MQKIYFFIDDMGNESVSSLLEKYDGENEIELYSDIIEGTGNNINICINEIIGCFKNNYNKVSIVTDVKEIYTILNECFNNCFENIEYIVSSDNTRILDEVDYESILQCLVDYAELDIEKKIIDKIISCIIEKNINEFNNITIMFYELKEKTTQKSWRFNAYWETFIKLLLKCETGKIKFSCEFKAFAYSILMKMSYNVQYTRNYIDIVKKLDLDYDNKYFLTGQFKRYVFLNRVAVDDNISENIDKMYIECFEHFKLDKRLKNKIPIEERNGDIVVVLTMQYLDETHAPTKTVNERVAALKKLGKKVFIINTTEQHTLKGAVPLYDIEPGRVIEENDGLNHIEEIASNMFQFPKECSLEQKLDLLIQLLKNIKPIYVLAVGTKSLMADLAGLLVDTASMTVVFSSLPFTMNKIKILGRKLRKDEVEKYKNIDIIESRFTFEMKKQKAHFTKKQYGIPETKFILVVVGTRLHDEMTHDFLKMLDKLSKSECYTIFAGNFEKFDNCMEDYCNLKYNSKYIGYCKDILALMEIIDLYVNPDRSGGGYSVIEAAYKGKPAVYLKKGDVYTAGGEDFAVKSFKQMYDMILKYKADVVFYKKMAQKAVERAALMTSSVESMQEIDNEILRRIYEKGMN